MYVCFSVPSFAFVHVGVIDKPQDKTLNIICSSSRLHLLILTTALLILILMVIDAFKCNLHEKAVPTMATEWVITHRGPYWLKRMPTPFAIAPEGALLGFQGFTGPCHHPQGRKVVFNPFKRFCFRKVQISIETPALFHAKKD